MGMTGGGLRLYWSWSFLPDSLKFMGMRYRPQKEWMIELVSSHALWLDTRTLLLSENSKNEGASFKYKLFPYSLHHARHCVRSLRYRRE